MEVKNLFEPEVYKEIIDRIDKLTPESQRQWGKMSVAQMLTHCKRAFRVPLSEKPLPRVFLGRLVGWMIKSKLYDRKPYAKNLPTSPAFIVREERDFDKEKSELLGLIARFRENGPGKAARYPHPFFGRIGPEQWGRAMWKHLDHHLRQFGV